MKSISLFLVTSLVLAMGLAACGSDNNKSNADRRQFSGNDLVVTESTELSLASGQLSGTGSVVFSKPLGAIQSGANYRLTFSLAETGVLNLVSHSDAEQNGGFVISFARESDEVEVTLLAAGETIEIGHLEGIDATGVMDLVIDVHNNETPAHVLIWNVADTTTLTPEHLESTALLNTAGDHDHDHEGEEGEEGHEGEGDHEGEDDHDHDHGDEDDHDHGDEAGSPGNGGGTLWGLQLLNATVTAATTAEPIFEE